MSIRAHKGWVFIGSLVAGALVLSGCSSSGISSGDSSGGDGASVPGVSSSEITVGNVATQGGPIPGLFSGAPFAVDAYFAYINSQGGVNGRKLVLKQGDDAYTCPQNLSQTKALKDSVFAFVANFSTFDNCGGAVFKADKTLPDFSVVLGDPSMNDLPNLYSGTPAPPGGQEGPLKWIKQEYPDSSKIGTLITNSPGAIHSWENNWEPLVKSLGFTVAYQRNYNATETDFTADVIRMRDAGVNFLYTVVGTPQMFGRLLSAAAQQNWHPTVSYNSSAYTTNFPKLVTGDAGDGTLYWQPQAPYLEGASSSWPSVKLLTEWMEKTHPGVAVDNFAASGWVNATLFVDALKTLGDNPTREGLLKAVSNIHDFTAGGFQAKSDVGAKKPPNCYLMMTYEKEKFKTIGSPSEADGGFQCDPGGYFFSNK